jgi:conjugal transfer/entry exclusion protein
MAYIIPAPLRQLIAERDSLKFQVDKLQKDYEKLQQKKAKALEDFDAELQVLMDRRSRLQTEWQQFNEAVEAMKTQFQIPEEPQEPPQ